MEPDVVRQKEQAAINMVVNDGEALYLALRKVGLKYASRGETRHLYKSVWRKTQEGHKEKLRLEQASKRYFYLIYCLIDIELTVKIIYLRACRSKVN